MGLNTLLARWATRRPHLLLVAGPGTAPLRFAVETWCRDHGAVLVATPTDADVLVVTGRPLGDVAGAADELWREMPGPRARTDIHALASVHHHLAWACEQLAAVTAPAQQRADEWQAGAETEHDAADMQMPAGLMMADRAEDRDGLKLDALPLALGPVMPFWPTGLVVDVVMQGDVVQQATPRPVSTTPGASSFWSSRPVAARLDCAAVLLGLAGWHSAAGRAVELRDRLLHDGSDGQVAEAVERLGRRVRRSVVVRSSLSGLAPVDGSDAMDRLVGWLSATGADLPFAQDVDRACARMVGLDLAAARLVMASLPPDLEIAVGSAVSPRAAR